MAMCYDRYRTPIGGYRVLTKHVQNLRFERDTVRYRLERGFSAGSRRFLEARLPEALQGQSFGPDLQAFVQMLYFELRVPEEKILTRLQALGLVISAGEISNILIKKTRRSIPSRGSWTGGTALPLALAWPCRSHGTLKPARLYNTSTNGHAAYYVFRS